MDKSPSISAQLQSCFTLTMPSAMTRPTRTLSKLMKTISANQRYIIGNDGNAGGFRLLDSRHNCLAVLSEHDKRGASFRDQH